MDNLSPAEPLDEIADFHTSRQKGLGATDSAAVLGVSPWAGPHDVWLDKEGAPPKPMSLPMWLGLKLQDTVAELYATQTETRVRRDNRQLQHPTYPWMLCHLDYRVWGKPKVLVECKTAHQYARSDYDDPPTGMVPVHYWVQCQHEMAVAGADECHLAVLFGHREFNWWRIVRDDEFISRLYLALEEFWTRYVLTHTPPPPDGSDRSAAFLRKRFPAESKNALLKPATPEFITEVIQPYRLARQNAAQVEQQIAKLEQRIIERIGTAAGIHGGSWEATYKWTKPGEEKPNWELVANSYRKMLEALDAPDLDTIQSLYTVAGKTSYPRFHWKDKETE